MEEWIDGWMDKGSKLYPLNLLKKSFLVGAKA